MNDPLDTMLQFASVGRILTAKIDRLLGEYHGIALRDLDLVLELQAAPEQRLTTAELAKRLDIASSDVIRLLVPLEHIGVTERQKDADNPRNTVVVLTEAGDILCTDAHITAGEATSFEFGLLWTTEQQDELAGILAKVPTRGETIS